MTKPNADHPPRTVLVHPARTDFVDRGVRHAGGRDNHCNLRLWAGDPAWLVLGFACLGLCLAWALVNDRVKLITYRILGAPRAALPSRAKVGRQSEAKVAAPPATTLVAARVSS
jgi:hypothetical protein